MSIAKTMLAAEAEIGSYMYGFGMAALVKAYNLKSKAVGRW